MFMTSYTSYLLTEFPYYIISRLIYYIGIIFFEAEKLNSFSSNDEITDSDQNQNEFFT